MQKRIQASMQTRQALNSLLEGRLSSPDARADLVKLATRLIVEDALEAEKTGIKVKVIGHQNDSVPIHHKQPPRNANN